MYRLINPEKITYKERTLPELNLRGTLQLQVCS